MNYITELILPNTVTIMNDFTYEIPNEEGFMKALLVHLKVNGLGEIAELLKGSSCEISHNQQFAYPAGRYNSFWTTLTIRIPVNEFENAVNKITDDVQRKILGMANKIMLEKAGLDILTISIFPSLEVTPFEGSLIPDLQSASEIMSNSLSKEILPEDITEKGKEMADVYVYLYCVENTLRLFVEKVAKENYGNSYFLSLNLNSPINKKLKIRKNDEIKNQWLRMRGDSEIFYLDFDDLGSIIRSNWQIFKRFFPSQEWIVGKVTELSKCRNLVAHNSYIGKSERELIRVYFNSILRQISSTI